MDHRLLHLLVCPLCKGPLEHRRLVPEGTGAPGSSELICHADRLAFPIRDGIPVMLEAQARSLDATPDASAAPAQPSQPEASGGAA